jgi:hypothetical protein
VPFKSEKSVTSSYPGQYVHRVAAWIQAKLKPGPPNDRYEQEADRVADAVMRTSGPQVQRQLEEEEEKKEDEELVQTKTIADQITPLVQRQVEEEEEEEELIQPKPLAEQITPLVQRQPEGEVVQSKSEKSVTSSYPGRYVHRVATWIQAKLKPGPPNDRYEQEADRVADAVMRAHEPQVQRQLEEEEEEEEELIQSKPLAEQITTLVQRQTEGVVMQSKSEKSVSSSYPGRYVHRVAAWIQAKLKPGPPNDRYEQEADRVADAVRRTSEPQVQRQLEEDEEEEKLLQAKQDNALVQRQPLEEEELLQTSFFEAPPVAQTKLIVCAQDDEYEREADRVAETVMRMPATPDTSVEEEELSGNATPSVQRMVEPKPEEESIIQPKRLSAFGIQRVYAQCTEELKTSHGEGPAIQTKAEGASALRITPDFQRTIQLSNGGLPLPDTVRSRIEPVLGADLGDVRVHSDANSNDAAKSLQAKAFTHQNHIWLASGQSSEDITLMAHEATHVVQQGAASQRPSHYDAAVQHTANTGSEVVQRNVLEDLGGVASGAWEATGGRIVSGVARGTRAVGAAVSRGAESIGERAAELYEGAQEYFVGILEDYAPGLLALLRGDIVGGIKERILSGMDALFGGLFSRIQEGGFGESLRSTLTELISGISNVGRELARGDCSSLLSAARALVEFGSALVGPVVDELRNIFTTVGGFFSDAWERFGSPAVETVRQLAGEAWDWIEDKALWVWEQTAEIREVALVAWQWLMRQFNLVWNTAGGVFDWFREKLTEAWAEVRELIQPILGPLQVVGAMLLLVSPLGPFVAVGAGAAGLWYGLRWLRDNWEDLEVVIWARELLHDRIIPAVMSGVEWLRSALDNAAAWISEQLVAISNAFLELLNALGLSPLLGALRDAVAFVSAQFDRLAEWVNTDVVPFLHEVCGVLQQVWDFVRPLFVLLGAVVLFPVYPWILPVVLAGWAWQAVPECLKEPLINFAIDVMILALESLPDFRNFGDAWPRVKEQIISALRDARAMDTADKIAMADRIARIMTGEDIGWIGNLIAAAREMPHHFWPQAQQELIGMDLSQPLPFERTSAPQPRESATADVEAGTLSAEDAAVLTRATLTERDIEVDQIASLELEPELVAGLNLDEGAEVEFGDSTDPSCSIEAIRDEMVAAGEGTPEEAMSVETTAGEQPNVEAQLQAMMDQPGPQSCENQAPSSTASQNDIPESMRIGPLTQRQRARYLLNQMGKGIRQWFSCNWQWLVPSVIGAIVLLVILEIVTGGAVTAALPPLMQIIGTIMIGVAIVKTGYYLADYLAKGVAGDVTAAARSLARGLAAGAIELVFALLFNIFAVIKSLKKGVSETLRAAARTVSETARRTRRAVSRLRETLATGRQTAAENLRRIAGATLHNGRLVMNGVGRSIGRGIRSLDDLARRLWRRVRFRRFKIRRVGGRRFQLLGHINPWYLLGEIVMETVGDPVRLRPRMGETVKTLAGEAKIYVAGNRRGNQFLRDLRNLDPPDRVLIYDELIEAGRRGGRSEIEGIIRGATQTAENARQLRANMLPHRGVPGSGNAAHHIVPSTHSYGSAVEAREILQRWRIEINEGLNGVFVPPDIHRYLHTHAYMDAVADTLRSATTRADAIQKLDDLAANILARHFIM